MKNIQLDLQNAISFINNDDFKKYEELTLSCDKDLQNKTGKGNDFLGWYSLPDSLNQKLIGELKDTAKQLIEKSDVIVVVGIGGSYLGAKAVIESLSGNFQQYDKAGKKPVILFAGQNLSEDYLYELLDFLKGKKYSVIVISKSGTTTEPAIAFRLLRKELEERTGRKEASERIVAITDAKKGALRNLAENEGCKSFVIDDDIGGRYSVLTPVGLLPIACAGFDIEKLIDGAKSMYELSMASDFEKNPVYSYAAIRHILYNNDKKIEILANYNPRLYYISEWWKQLFGESEGKENKGIFPASVNFTTDLHSMGQYMQEGLRNMFETVISVENTKYNLKIPLDKDNLDNLNYLADKNIDFVNKMAELGTTLAHVDGGVPNIRITMPEINEFYIGQLLYFFEKSCAISGYLSGINPFDQPGVEAYKKNMFALLEKPGFEKETKKIKERIN